MLGDRLMSGFNGIMAEHELPLRLAGLPPMPQASYPQGVSAELEQLFSLLLERGYFIHPIRPWFISAAHTMDDIEQTLVAIDDAVRNLRRS
jgi:glutamate-1-semialdehyde aminotransferase